MKKKIWILAFVTMVGILLGNNISAMQVFSEDEGYRISCLTRNGGLRCVDVTPDAIVRPNSESESLSQKFFFRHIGNGYHLILNFNKTACLEAYPKDGLVKLAYPRDHDGPQDQHWRIYCGVGMGGKISCHTKNRGLCVLEAFPNHGVIKPVGENGDMDQCWYLTRWPSEEIQKGTVICGQM
jgi:hypothetical protein